MRATRGIYKYNKINENYRQSVILIIILRNSLSALSVSNDLITWKRLFFFKSRGNYQKKNYLRIWALGHVCPWSLPKRTSLCGLNDYIITIVMIETYVSFTMAVLTIAHRRTELILRRALTNQRPFKYKYPWKLKWPILFRCFLLNGGQY